MRAKLAKFLEYLLCLFVPGFYHENRNSQRFMINPLCKPMGLLRLRNPNLRIFFLRRNCYDFTIHTTAVFKGRRNGNDGRRAHDVGRLST